MVHLKLKERRGEKEEVRGRGRALICFGEGVPNLNSATEKILRKDETRREEIKSMPI